jgi:septum formation protein
MQTPTLILASTSPIRKTILQNAGLTFTCHKPNTDETALKSQLRNIASPKLAMALASAKALSLKHRSALIIGADQTLTFKKQRYDKPQNYAELRAQLASFRAAPHILHSALAIAQNGKIIWTTCQKATLTMRNFSEDFLDSYIKSSGPEILECVGGYKLEATGAQLFKKIEGDYFTILGLPLLPLLAYLRQQNYLTS